MKNTRRKTLLVALLVSVLLLAGASTPLFAGGAKVTICHNRGTAGEGTIEVSENAVPAHLAHGDTLGACEPGVVAVTCPFTGNKAIEATIADGDFLQLTVEYPDLTGVGTLWLYEMAATGGLGIEHDATVPWTYIYPADNPTNHNRILEAVNTPRVETYKYTNVLDGGAAIDVSILCGLQK